MNHVVLKFTTRRRDRFVTVPWKMTERCPPPLPTVTAKTLSFTSYKQKLRPWIICKTSHNTKSFKKTFQAINEECTSWICLHFKSQLVSKFLLTIVKCQIFPDLHENLTWSNIPTSCWLPELVLAPCVTMNLCNHSRNKWEINKWPQAV